MFQMGQQDYILFWRLLGRKCLLAFSSFQKLSTFLGWWACMTPFSVSRTHLLLWLWPSYLPLITIIVITLCPLEWSPHLKNLNLLTSVIPFYHVKYVSKIPDIRMCTSLGEAALFCPRHLSSTKLSSPKGGEKGWRWAGFPEVAEVATQMQSLPPQLSHP